MIIKMCSTRIYKNNIKLFLSTINTNKIYVNEIYIPKTGLIPGPFATVLKQLFFRDLKIFTLQNLFYGAWRSRDKFLSIETFFDLPL
jgi:hypothetical protein